ncbi:hypothetical protein V6N13_137546 [Hibiscus sabdariffa]|uniref:Far1-related sequence 3 n=1 Tax=Hibiscus sabdariffa TaxID=183260 RepID=A0ABR2DKB9_9ROSI
MLMYTSFPLLFSALVTASPVLVCTAVLLGTLLSFGSPYIPETNEKEGEEEKLGLEVSELETEATEDHTVVERDVGFVRYKLLVNADLDSRDICCEDGVIDEAEGSLNDSLVEKKREIREGILGSEDLLSMAEASDDHHVLADAGRDGNLEVEDHKLKEDLSDEQRGEQFDSTLVFAKRSFDDDDESLDSGSDSAESPSPDASMADIIPMLDELHPLLSSEAPQPAQLSGDGSESSDTASERSHGTNNDESAESDDLENQGEEDNNVDDGEGEGAKGDKEDESKSAMKWTEDDQKNLMDLGTSELERNQRLHNLIARRRARKSMGFGDLNSVNIPLSITPISVTRRNPFEFPYDSYDDLGLPPIPGSAPTILQQRRIPFDLPYDSGEEKPDLRGDSFQEEFAGFNQRETVPQREAFLRRHESFNVGPSSLGVTKKEFKWKPYFVLETEETSPTSFQSQSSEVSESKLSSVSDTESVSLVEDEEDSESCEQDDSQETELIANKVHASSQDEQESLSSGDVEPVGVEQVENRVVRHDVVEITLGGGQSQLEMESNLPEDGASAHVELKGIEIEPMPHVGLAENRDVHHDVVVTKSGDEENQQETESNLSEAGATTHVELNPSEIHSRTKSVDEDFSSGSSLSLSEINEKISVSGGEGSAGFEPKGREINKSGIFSQPSFEESEFHFTVKVVDDKHSEPVYDSSPSVEKVLSFSSVSSNGQAGISQMGASSMLVASIDKEPEGHAETTEQGISSFQKMHDAFSDLLENEPRARDLPEISELGVTHAGSLSVSTTFADRNVSMVPESAVEYASRDGVSSSSDEESEDGVPNKEESFIQNQVDLLCLGARMTLAVEQGIDKMLDSSPEEQQHLMNRNVSSEAEPGDRHAVDEEDTQLERDEIHSSSSSEHDLVGDGVWPKEEIMHLSNFDASPDVDGRHDEREEFSSTALTHQHMPYKDASSSTAEESYHTVVAQVSRVDPAEAGLREVHRIESEMDQVQPTCLNSKIDTGLDHDMNSEGISSNSNYQATPELENQLLGSDDEPPIYEHVKLEELSIIATESRREVDIGNNDLNVHSVPESDDKLSAMHSSMISESASSKSESSEHMLLTDQEDLKNRILNVMQSEGSPHEVSEHFNHAAEVYATYVVEDFNVEKIDLLEGSHVAYTESALLPEFMMIKTDVEVPVLEPRSAEDIDLAFKQLHEGVDVEEAIIPSMTENQQDRVDTNPELPVVVARSLGNIRSALQQGLESNTEELPLCSDLQNGSSEVEQNDAVSAKEMEATNEPKNEYQEASEQSSLNLKGKKAKSHES